jgi:hypothetical protein
MTTTQSAGPRTSELGLPWLYAMRFGYLVLATGLTVTVWTEVLDPSRSWSVMEGAAKSLLAALGLLSLLGLRHPVRMLPILLFECAWKLIWLAAVGVQAWRSDRIDTEMAEMMQAVLWVVLILPVVPWHHVYHRYLAASGDRWRPAGRTP